jgi:two-component system CheB/CheR fusion protein
VESPPNNQPKPPRGEFPRAAESPVQASTPASAASDFNRLIEYLRQSRGFDFSGYKVSSLMRRIQKRMREIGIESYQDYIDFLEVHPDEFLPLFNTILINVTEFFRDPAGWEFLAKEIVPRILAERGPERQVRVWSAGCASGEEAFSAAITLAEAMGEEAFRHRAKIYATDVDEDALATARQGVYDAARVASVPPELLARYFEPQGDRYVFRAELRRCLIFGRYDLVQDAAISRLDLLLCRNTLMYFNSETQDRILARFHFALSSTGYLFLGKAETLLAHSDSFRPVELRHRIFARTPTGNLRDRLLAMTPGGPEQPWSSRHLRLRDYAYDTSPVAQVAVDRRGLLLLANDRARKLFGIAQSDLGRLLQDLELSYKPVELRSHLENAYAERGLVLIPHVEWRPPGEEESHFEVQILPLVDVKGVILGASIAFLDITQSHQLRSQLERAHQELETAYEELQSANEELETTNEELQSTVEELETTNEELQSANEELETMNEELQSTNDELRVINDQIHVRSEELDRVSAYFESVLTSLRAAVVVLDRDLRVALWSDKAQDLWGLRPEEAHGESFLALDIGLPVALLEGILHEGLTGRAPSQEKVVDGINRLGKPVRCLVSCTTLRRGNQTHGIVLLMEEAGG